MADQATQTMEIAAPADRIRDVLLDFPGYPAWARDVKGVTVDAVDEVGRGLEVTYRAAAMGRSTSYTLRYEYDDTGLRWHLVRGDIMRRLDGSYVLEPILEPIPGAPERTRVTYHLAVDLIVPLPAFVKRRAESRVVHAALRELRAHVEP